MNLKDYIVKKDFLSTDFKRCYKPGEIYNGGPKTLHTRMLIKHGFIEEPQCTKKPAAPTAAAFLALLFSAFVGEDE